MPEKYYPANITGYLLNTTATVNFVFLFRSEELTAIHSGRGAGLFSESGKLQESLSQEIIDSANHQV
ncbi:MAG: hypothetical protein AMJ55_06040 [Gammaproteobacteria bacterium SG8_15]|nr:MAG: hypothetical protein AMJ55_06040 [Gammaproteobacteria bacterium SG8_15]